jgi:hypothetical protein
MSYIIFEQGKSKLELTRLSGFIKTRQNFKYSQNRRM